MGRSRASQNPKRNYTPIRIGKTEKNWKDKIPTSPVQEKKMWTRRYRKTQQTRTRKTPTPVLETWREKKKQHDIETAEGTTKTRKKMKITQKHKNSKLGICCCLLLASCFLIHDF